MWVKKLMGIIEQNPAQVRSQLQLSTDANGNKLLTSLVNKKQVQCGILTIPSLGELREQAQQACGAVRGKLVLSQIVANVKTLHTRTNNAGALFQVASQFNLLEMISPNTIPEKGVGIYECDHTQGPTCAIACGGGTLYRNYFVRVNGENDPILGQTATHQVDCLQHLGQEMGNKNNSLWTMQNGYARGASPAGLAEINRVLQNCTEAERDHFRSLLRIGIQSNAQVTVGGCNHCVTQAYCSALAVGYDGQNGDAEYENWARLILEASYEATFCAAVVNAAQTCNRKVFLTLIGGGVFRNRVEWILDAIERAARKFQDSGLDVAIVSYRESNYAVEKLIERLHG